MNNSYRSWCLHDILAWLDHVVAEETEGKVIVWSDDAGEGGHDGNWVKEVLKNLWGLHLNIYEIKLLVFIFIIYILNLNQQSWKSHNWFYLFSY